MLWSVWHGAVLAALSYVQSGRLVAVDVDLEKFLDRINHDILIDRLQKRISDAEVIRLIRAYLTAASCRMAWFRSGNRAPCFSL
jgi:retron-type reverse transcriptase